MNRFDRIFRDQKMWSEQTFGSYEERRENGALAGLLTHLREEAIETQWEEDPSKQIEEVADIFIIAMEIAGVVGLSQGELEILISAKQLKNRNRIWPSKDEQDPSKPINHDRRFDQERTL
jgi:predicted house-cleaning noncanonical NTP pyrophosphatase (MazG superfamily)